jgi:hypothetical protein
MEPVEVSLPVGVTEGDGVPVPVADAELLEVSVALADVVEVPDDDAVPV